MYNLQQQARRFWPRQSRWKTGCGAGEKEESEESEKERICRHRYQLRRDERSRNTGSLIVLVQLRRHKDAREPNNIILYEHHASLTRRDGELLGRMWGGDYRNGNNPTYPVFAVRGFRRAFGIRIIWNHGFYDRGICTISPATMREARLSGNANDSSAKARFRVPLVARHDCCWLSHGSAHVCEGLSNVSSDYIVKGVIHTIESVVCPYTKWMRLAVAALSTLMLMTPTAEDMLEFLTTGEPEAVRSWFVVWWIIETHP